ncbi:MAG: formylglycine-generating enzyme family protein, partial [Pirellulaceae bacterium]
RPRRNARPSGLPESRKATSLDNGGEPAMFGSFIRRTTRLLKSKTPTQDDDLAPSPDHAPTDTPSATRKGRDHHYCVVLAADEPVSADESELADGSELADESELAVAWKSLEEQMALVPAGETTLMVTHLKGVNGSEVVPRAHRVRVRAVYLDRYAVTNEDYAQFVAAGAYRRPEWWPPQILPHVLHFTDRMGTPGPKFWSDGRPPRDKLKHPVVGICWYEANAYACWVGKRLPTPAEWQRAGCWTDGDDAERRFPWGNAFDPKRTNTWLGGPGDTVPVQDYYEGCTPNGVYQLVGNVWEWVAAAFECVCDDKHSRVVFERPMGEIRGGAFDTYFANQSTCQFRSGQPLPYRGTNVGFRCCVSADQLRTVSKPFVIP